MPGIENQKVVLIGGTMGMGLAAAVAAAERGAHVVVASRKQSNVDEALEQLPAGSEGFVLDASDEDAVREFFPKVGPFDHLVFTAGTHVSFTALSDVSLAYARACFEDRFFMPFMAAKYGSPHLRPHGSIVLTSGVAAARPAAGVVVHSSTSGAVETLTRALAVELGPLRVNAVRVGPLQRSLDDDPERAELFEAILRRLPVGRFGQWSEVGAAYVHLMENGYVTGSVMDLDGGYVLV
ncbi:SDR family oxidoreductase [Nocardiopsis deserti]|uniref:SDR family oxidoreductase n=1 Tax=Nocardiopsis deserti TaxID=2605988 RepID=UPI001CC24B3D|nr:SDR family oxidoreductase [Nocardiopsis deserti]